VSAMTKDATMGLSPVGTRQNLREQVTEALWAHLVTGRLVPGELYSAPTLAAEFGVSATPVREAMLDLARAGLVEPVRNKGFRVTQMSEHELDSLAELRALIEIPTMAAVAREVTEDTAAQIEALRPVVTEMLDAAHTADLRRYITLDTQFHLALLALHGNDEIVEVVRGLRGRTRLFGLQVLADNDTLVQNAAEHLDILDAALARDGEAMARHMTRHIGHVRHLWAGRPAAGARGDG